MFKIELLNLLLLSGLDSFISFALFLFIFILSWFKFKALVLIKSTLSNSIFSKVAVSTMSILSILSVSSSRIKSWVNNLEAVHLLSGSYSKHFLMKSSPVVVILPFYLCSKLYFGLSFNLIFLISRLLSKVFLRDAGNCPKIELITWNWSDSLSPGNNGCPLIISPIMQPKAQMSLDLP